MSAAGQLDETARADDPAPPLEEAYRAALDFLYQRINYEQLPRERYSASGFKLDRMQALLERLGNPQLDFPAIHIAGTKGKGSTAAICASVLESVGYRVGLYTSPHLSRFEERMRVNGAEPSPAEVVSLVQDVSAAADSLAREGAERRPTFFEIITAMAWKYFQQARAELVVLEVGLGGRLDATNICAPAATVITSISRDHTRLLGDTLPEIAREKAGIIKPQVPVISGVADESAAEVIECAAQHADAPLYRLGRDIRCSDLRSESTSDPLPRWNARITTPWRQHPACRIPLPGQHQIANTALALAAVDCVTQRASPPTDDSIANGLDAVRWPLRIEMLRRNPLVIADAAHNVASLAGLVATLRDVPAAHRTAVFSVSQEKDVADMLRIVGDHFDRIVLTQFSGNPRVTPLAELAAIAETATPTECTAVESPLAAWQTALADSRGDDLICITGSFFLAAELRDVILQDT